MGICLHNDVEAFFFFYTFIIFVSIIVIEKFYTLDEYLGAMNSVKERSRVQQKENSYVALVDGIIKCTPISCHHVRIILGFHEYA